jgi:DNA (cytosine-5)-methyltransferase 1
VPKSLQDGPLALSLFSGCGGLDLGLERAGWLVAGQVEMDADAAGTLRLHAEQSDVGRIIRQQPIEHISPRSLRDSLGLRRGQLTLMAGGPPCQPFTTSGLRQALQDRRASSLFPAYLDYIREFQPRSLLIENVDGMLSAALRHRPLHLRGRGNPPLDRDEMKGSFLRWLVESLSDEGYAVAWGVVEAADYGVPQMRQRAILLGVRGSDPCWLPPHTHGSEGFPSFRTLRDALAEVKELGCVQPLSAAKRRVYELIPPGRNWRELPIELQKATMGAAYTAEGGRSGWWRRLSWDQPAPTILGMPDHSSTALIHPDEVRCLSVNECAAVQSFPTGTRFAGSSRSQYQQIGNAVPPRLGEALGRELLRFLEGQRKCAPSAPAWRKASANRRIGTHGWTVREGPKVSFHLAVRVRKDHIWAVGEELDVA